LKDLEVPDAGLVIGIETSCDETAVAVTCGSKVLSSVIESQVALHASFGGVVPEMAARAHDAAIVDAVSRALQLSGADFADLQAVAVTSGPGLPGSLAVGVAYAQGLAISNRIPLVGVNHMEGHLFAAALVAEVPLPALVLLVSGGHTELISVAAPGQYLPVAKTVDDAAGEAFDKVARLLDLGYPGGPAIERASNQGDPQAIRFPRAMVDSADSWSFSGLKTSVLRYVEAHPDLSVADVAASFQRAVVDVLLDKVERGFRQGFHRSLVLGGGVGANGLLRSEFEELAGRLGVESIIPEPRFCTDNGAMIAACASWKLASGHRGDRVLDTVPSARLVG
jgi:N6-L-threonylcarbamoyladenine synthase